MPKERLTQREIRQMPDNSVIMLTEAVLESLWEEYPRLCACPETRAALWFLWQADQCLAAGRERRQAGTVSVSMGS